MTNLISNALKYTPKGEKVIIEVLDKGEFVNISVENKGANIPDARTF